MEIPLRYSIFFAGSHWKVDSSQGKAAPTSLFDLWAYLGLGSGGLSCAPVWGRRSPPAAPQPQVLLPRGHRRGPHCSLPSALGRLPRAGTDTGSDWPGGQHAPAPGCKVPALMVFLSKRVVVSPTAVPQTLPRLHGGCSASVSGKQTCLKPRALRALPSQAQPAPGVNEPPATQSEPGTGRGAAVATLFGRCTQPDRALALGRGGGMRLPLALSSLPAVTLPAVREARSRLSLERHGRNVASTRGSGAVPASRRVVEG